MPLVFPFILLIVALSNKVLLSEIPGRADYRDGSPCAYCWITVEIEKQLIKVRTYQSFLNGTVVQKLSVKDCYLFVDRDVALFNGFSQFRSVEVDLSKLESLKSCGKMESACIYLSPAQIVGNRSHLDQDGGVIFFDKKHRKHISFILNSIALLARSCGNLKAEVIHLETIPPSVSK